jgi:hypothetical protein
MMESSPAMREAVELWRRAFGEPPPVLVEPEQMLALITAYELQHARRRKVRH